MTKDIAQTFEQTLVDRANVVREPVENSSLGTTATTHATSRSTTAHAAATATSTSAAAAAATANGSNLDASAASSASFSCQCGPATDDGRGAVAPCTLAERFTSGPSRWRRQADQQAGLALEQGKGEGERAAAAAAAAARLHLRITTRQLPLRSWEVTRCILCPLDCAAQTSNSLILVRSVRCVLFVLASSGRETSALPHSQTDALSRDTTKTHLVPEYVSEPRERESTRSRTGHTTINPAPGLKSSEMWGAGGPVQYKI